MTITREKMNAIFKECNKFFDEIESMDNRKIEAQNDIVKLQDEIQKLKVQRPTLLAESKSVAKINKKLKKIKEDIELKEDLVKGVTEKKKSLNYDIYRVRMKKQEAFQEYVKSIKSKVAQEYMEIAPKFAEIVREYLILEYMCHETGSNYVSSIPYKDIKRIPNLHNNTPLFEYKLHDLYLNYDDVVKEKYNIPDYEVHKIPLPNSI